MRLSTDESLGSLAARWDQLVEQMALPSPFLRSWWIDNTAGAAPVVLTCWEGDSLIGGAAFEADRIGRGRVSMERLRMLGQGPLAPDHLDVVSAPGREAEVTDLVLSWVRRPGQRLVDLDGLAGSGHLARRLETHVIDRVGAPWTPLAATVDDQLADLPGQLRNTIKRSTKRLVKSGATMRVADRDDGERALDDLAALHDDRWADGSSFLDSWIPFRRAALAGISTGDVIVHELVSPLDPAAEVVRVVASELDLVCGGRVAFYQAGRLTDHEWRGSGSALKAHVIERAIDDGCREYDLLRGDESYKDDWTSQRRELVRVRFGVGVAGRALALVTSAWWRAAPALYEMRDRARSRLVRDGSAS